MSQKIAFLFPGQGSQSMGMGRDITDQFPGAKKIFEQVDEICEKPISKLCFEGPMEELTLTVNLQPAITAVNLACLKALNKSGIRPAVSAGHSLGEYAALASAGGISDYDALRLVKIPLLPELIWITRLVQWLSWVRVVGLAEILFCWAMPSFPPAMP